MINRGDKLIMEAGSGQAYVAAIECTVEDIYRRYYNSVYRTCLRLIANQTEAEDLTQDVFMQVQRHWHTFRGDSSVVAWLYRIAINQVYMHWRKKAVQCERVTSTGELPDDAKPFACARAANASVEAIALLKAIEHLPDGMRAVLILHDIYGYNHDEIGRRLGLHSGTSKSQLHKARLKVRELMRA